MASSSDVDANFKKALYLMHTDDPQSATELRLLLDELIKQRYGPSKMLANLVTSKHLELEKSFPGIATEKPETEQIPTEAGNVDEVINLTNSPTKTISDSPDTIADSDDVAMLTIPTNEEVENLKEFGDLNCCVCGEMVFTATNRLIECSQCGSLYHQECHKPTITNEETCDEKERTWQCNSCNDKPSTSKAAAAAVAAATAAAAATVVPVEEPMPLIAKTKSSASSSRSSSSSNSSSPFHKQESSSSSSKHHKSSSSKMQKEDRSTMQPSSSRTSTVVTPSMNIVTTCDKGSVSSSSKSRSSSSHSSSSKSSSSKSSSKHHESSKRKLKK